MFRIFILLFWIVCVQAERQQTVAFYAARVEGLKPWDPDSIKTGINGSEEAVIYMSQKLAKLGYKVTVLGDPPPNSRHSREDANPRFVSLEDKNLKFTDVAISCRMPRLGLLLKNWARKVYLWPQDVCLEILPAKEVNAFDDVFWLSEWQKNQWASVNPGFAKFKTIHGNAIIPEQVLPVVERKNPYSCIYGSNYGRGLKTLLDIWPSVKKEFPKATLDIYYGWKHWGTLTESQVEEMKRQIKNLEKLDVREHGSVGHEELQKAYAEASFWTYPCDQAETFCITAIRAQLAGAVPVILVNSALSETVRHGYRCLKKEEYLPTLLKAMRNAEKITLEQRKEMGQFVLEEYTWDKFALSWKDIFNKPSKQIAKLSFTP
jgi:hypothetical protein